MKNIKDKINDLYNQMGKIRNEVISAIKEYVKENGCSNSEGVIVLGIHSGLSECIDLVNILVCDLHTDGRYYEPFESLEINKNDELVIRTVEGNSAHQSSANLFDLIEVYEFLLYLDEEHPQDILIENGMIKPQK